MNYRQVKRPRPRYETPDLPTLGVQAYGANNLYPDEVAAIIAESSTGSSCLRRYARFIEGNGFCDEAFSASRVNSEETADEFLAAVAADLAKFNGFAIHVRYNLFGRISAVKHVPFEMCRLSEENEAGRVTHIVVHPDWSGRATRGRKRVAVSKDNCKRFHVYDPSEALAQMAEAGGVALYAGQIYYITAAGRNKYGAVRYDDVITELSTEAGLANVGYRNARNNFLPTGMLITRSGQMPPENGGEDFATALADYQGDENACSMFDVTIDTDEDKPEFVPFPVQNFDKAFTNTEARVVEHIYSAFEQESFYCQRIGKIGFGGDVIADTNRYYSDLCGKERRMIERAAQSIFSLFVDKICPSGDFSIRPIIFETAQ